ncbi:hypothetical protein IF2G_10601 [Cordyceps javanica]|nr:hypothetical protein IF2G_10601 [Cordyceps javanica]
MTNNSECKVLGNIDAVKSSIFASYEWVDEIHRLGSKLVFYGIDLVSLTDGLEDRLSGRCTKTAYIALDLVH